MNYTPEPLPKNVMSRIKRLKLVGFFILLAENLTDSFWRLFFWILLFAALWLFEIPAALGQWAEILTFIIFISGVGFFLRKDARHFRWPSSLAIDKRLQTASGLAHEPLRSLPDIPAGEIDESAARLWIREQSRKLATLSRLRLFSPRAFVAAKDPRGVRLLIALAAVCGFLTAGPDALSRIQTGLMPFHGDAQGEKPENLTLIITAPAYTGKSQVVLHGAEKGMLEIPEGSALKVILRQRTLPFMKPSLFVDEDRRELKPADEYTSVLETAIDKGSTLSLKNGIFPVAAWNIRIIKDQPPRIESGGDPSVLSQGQIKIPVKMLDDYGVQTLGMNMHLEAQISMALGANVDELRSVMSPANTEFSMTPVYDLTSHPWAGLATVITMTATDQKGQTATLAPIKMVLPERKFTNPLAVDLIAIRKSIIKNPLDSYQKHYRVLEGFLYAQESQLLDRQTRLGLRAATSRMAYNNPSAEVSGTLVSLLWDIALHLEDDNLSLSARNLKDAQNALQDALQNPQTTPEEIAQLMDKLRQAMQDYLQAMAQEYQKRAQNGDMPPEMPPEMMSNMMDMDALAKMFDQMEADAMAGNKDAAQNMLSQLQRFMDMANPSMQTALPKDVEAMMKAMKDLKSLVDEQEKLLEETQKQAELLSTLDAMGLTKGREPPPFLHSQENAAVQEALRQRLEDLMKALEENSAKIPEGFNGAEEQMQGAASSLKENAPDIAITQQEAALKLLKQGQEQMSQAMRQRMQGMTGLSLFSGGPQRFDPLGRPLGDQEGPNGQARESNVKVPSEAERKRLQEIVNELRRRSGQRDRPQEELEYYRRLLKRF
jgi:uncharacterized protein (TIGR02302 family)